MPVAAPPVMRPVAIARTIAPPICPVRALTGAKRLLDHGDVAFVAHGHTLRVAAARWLGRGAVDGRDFTIDTASIAALGFEHGRQAISRWNLTAALADSA